MSSRSELTDLNNQPLIEAAQAYASAGWPVLPLAPGQKTPITLHGLKDASTDTDRVAAWWAQTPDANIGLLTGTEFDVLDVDGPDGAESLRVLIGTYHHPGPVSSTGKGWHLLFDTTGAPNGANLRSKLDYRGANGYIAAPPSLHPNGNRYLWARGSLTEPLPAAPDWLFDLVTPSTRHRGDRVPLPPDTEHALSLLNIVTEFTALGIELRAEGNHYRGRCPWHADDTPSLVVYPDTQSFYCFGCTAWGDALNLRRWEREGQLR